MFCTGCGRELEEGALFCPECGRAVDGGGTAPDAGDAAQSATPVLGPASPRPRRRGRVVAVALVATLLVVVLGVVAWQLLSRPDEPARASFGQEEAVRLAPRTRVLPRDAAGEALDAYVVALVPADEGGDADPADAPYVLEVEGTEGFAVSDFDAEVPDGAYTLVVTPAVGSGDSDDSGDDAAGAADDLRLPVELDSDDAEAPAEVVVTPPAGEAGGAGDEPAADDPEAARARAHALYLEKCEEYVAAYGEPSVATVDGGSVLREARGLALVRLVDFDGDGLEELLVAYAEQGLDSASALGDEYLAGWHVEVWAYADGALERVYDEPHTVAYSNGGSVFLPVYESEDGLPVLGTLEFGVGGESMAFYGYADGAFDVLLEAEVQYPSAGGSAQPRYLLDGAEVTGDEYLSDPLVSQFGTSEAYFLLDWPGAAGREGMHDVEETVALTEEALAELEGGAGA